MYNAHSGKVPWLDFHVRILHKFQCIINRFFLAIYSTKKKPYYHYTVKILELNLVSNRADKFQCNIDDDVLFIKSTISKINLVGKLKRMLYYNNFKLVPSILILVPNQNDNFHYILMTEYTFIGQ